MASSLTYFSLLGLSEDATQEEVEGRYRELAEFLSSSEIPEHLNDWAARESALVDEAYAVLLDPEQRTAGRRQLLQGFDDEPDEEEPAPRPRGETRPARAERRRGTLAAQSRRPLIKHPLVIGAVIGLVAVGAILVGRNSLSSNDDNGPAANQDAAAENAPLPLDTKRIAQLQAAVEKDPTNTEILFEIGESYFQAQQWQPAIDWFTKLVAIDTKNVHARTDIGTAAFNLNRPDEAKASWLAALELAPDDVQLHYNMGFLYANIEPRDLVSARKEWQKVVDLDPASSLAKTVQVHLNSLPAE